MRKRKDEQWLPHRAPLLQRGNKKVDMGGRPSLAAIQKKKQRKNFPLIKFSPRSKWILKSGLIDLSILPRGKIETFSFSSQPSLLVAWDSLNQVPSFSRDHLGHHPNDQGELLGIKINILLYAIAKGWSSIFLVGIDKKTALGMVFDFWLGF